MKKKISKILATLCIAGIAMAYPTVAHAAQDSFVINQYSESFVPAEDNNATLYIEMTATSSDEGLVYIPVNVADSEIVTASINGEEVSAELEKVGGVQYFVLDTETPATEVNVEAEINCPGFYAVENDEPDTGIPNPLMDYQFVNKLQNKIEKYNLTIALPEGMEPMMVTTPKDVTKYTLGMNEEGQRTLSLKSNVKVAGNAAFKFTFGKPFVGSTMSKVVLWVAVLGISAFVLNKRLKEEV